MIDDKNNFSTLPLNTLDQIPTPKPDASEIVGLVKESGRVVGYKLSNGAIVTKDEGVAIAKQGGIKGVGISSRDGNEYLKSIPDDSENNNLNNLPSIT